MHSELKMLGRLLAALTLTCVAGIPPLHADSCITLNPATAATRITVGQDEAGVTVRIAGPAKVSGDISPYEVSSDAGGVVWTAALPPDTSVSTSRNGGVVKVCQTVAPASTVAQAPTVKAVPPTTQTSPTEAATPASSPPGQGNVKESPQTKSGEGGAPTKPAAVSSGQDQAGASTETAVACAPGQPQAPSGAPPTISQTTLSDPEKVFTQGVETILTATDPSTGVLLPVKDRLDGARRRLQDLAPFILCLAKPTISRRLLSDAEEKRIDQQVSTTQLTTGTSVASKGSVPWLFGFAAEAGALTQSSSNNVLTFSGTPANVVKALKAKDYLASYTVGDKTPLVKWLFTPLSFSVSFNVAQSSGSNSSTAQAMSMARGMAATPASTTTAGANGTLAGYTIRYSIWNHRDARDPRYQKQWNDFVDANAPAMLKAIGELGRFLVLDPRYSKAFEDWQVANQNAISDPDMKPEQVRQLFLQRVAALQKVIGSDASAQELLDKAAVSIANYSEARNNILTSISNSTAVAFEYTETQQSNLLGSPVTVINPNPAVKNPIPNLSTFNFVVEKGSLGATQFTANASTTIYNSIPAGTHIGRVQSYRAAVQADIPLPEIKNVGMPIFTFSGLFLSLLNQPLGQNVVVNDVPISLTGNIWLFQSKFSLKVKNSGVKIPVALTYTNRTELNKESDVRGSIGVTYNLDSLFANSK
jgi:hypothetical protein